uniref:Organ specific protein n=1 Tax=Panagrellus redivivus TaxID=6233 RepID=A0A7E4W3Q0_PANRE
MSGEHVLLYLAACIVVANTFPAKSFDPVGIDKVTLSGSESMVSGGENLFTQDAVEKHLPHDDIRIPREKRETEVEPAGVPEPPEDLLSPRDFKSYSAQFDNNTRGGKVKVIDFEEALEKTVPYDSDDFS